MNPEEWAAQRVATAAEALSLADASGDQADHREAAWAVRRAAEAVGQVPGIEVPPRLQKALRGFDE